MGRNSDEGAYMATAFLIDGRQLEVDFLHRWAVAWLNSRVNGPYKRKETWQNKFVSIKAYKREEGLTCG